MASDAPAAMSRRELEEKIVARAWKDDDFRRKFLADPKRQFELHLGTKLPDHLQITAHEESDNTLHFVIPHKPAQNLDELSDEELEKVAGGLTPTVPLVSMIVASLAASAGGSALGVVIGQGKGGWNG
ncbi:MAG TPA: class IIb bacteriocin, lactobin A/cerein 7B family [Stellaceae bacterium]|nr:class IIb bacteriocin, lactobin A/cerein 7B family [Stellaceae bacterium]